MQRTNSSEEILDMLSCWDPHTELPVTACCILYRLPSLLDVLVTVAAAHLNALEWDKCLPPCLHCMCFCCALSDFVSMLTTCGMCVCMFASLLGKQIPRLPCKCARFPMFTTRACACACACVCVCVCVCLCVFLCASLFTSLNFCPSDCLPLKGFGLSFPRNETFMLFTARNTCH